MPGFSNTVPTKKVLDQSPAERLLVRLLVSPHFYVKLTSHGEQAKLDDWLNAVNEVLMEDKDAV